MTIRVTGVLPDPMGNPCAKALIRYTAITTEYTMVSGVEGAVTTSDLGLYDFPLEYGRYRVEILFDDEYHETGIVLVDEFTPSPVTLQELVQYATPYTPPIIDPTPTDWDTLLDGVIQNDEWSREAEMQVRDGVVFSNSDKTIHKAGDAYLAKETVTTTSGSISAMQQMLSYEDNNTRSASNKLDQITNATLSHKNGVETYIDQGTEEAYVHSTLTGSNSTVSSKDSIDNGAIRKETLTRKNANSVQTLHEVTSATASINEQVSFGSVTTVANVVADALGVTRSVNLTRGAVSSSDSTLLDDEKSTRNIIVDEFNVGDVLTVDNVTKEMTLRGRLTLTNPEDFKGEAGNQYYYEYAYATDAEKEAGNWTIDDPDDPYDVVFGEVTWRRHRHITVIDGQRNVGEWSEPYLLTGADGAVGDTIYWVYRYSPTNTVDDNTAEAPTGWDLELKDGDLYRIERLYKNGGWDGVWSTPAKIAGADGDNGEIVFEEYLYGADGTAAVNPPEAGKWNANFNEGDFYRISRLVKYPAGTPIPIPEGTNPSEVTPWSDPIKIVPERNVDYFDGVQGVNGNHGSGSYIVEVAAVGDIPPDAGKDLAIEALADRPAQAGDILTYTDDMSSGSGTFSKQYLRGTSTWSEFFLKLDGSVIVNDTLAAESLKSGSSITDILYVSNSNSRAELTLSGSGKWSDGSNTYDSDYRMWMGHQNPANACVSFHKNGTVKMKGADIEGTIKATAGQICNRLTVGNGYIDGRTNYDFLNVCNGKVRITGSGILCAQGANIAGTVCADSIVGDIMTAKTLSPLAAGNGGWCNVVTFSGRNNTGKTGSIYLAPMAICGCVCARGCSSGSGSGTGCFFSRTIINGSVVGCSWGKATTERVSSASGCSLPSSASNTITFVSAGGAASVSAGASFSGCIQRCSISVSSGACSVSNILGGVGGTVATFYRTGSAFN